MPEVEAWGRPLPRLARQDNGRGASVPGCSRSGSGAPTDGDLFGGLPNRRGKAGLGGSTPGAADHGVAMSGLTMNEDRRHALSWVSIALFSDPVWPYFFQLAHWSMWRAIAIPGGSSNCWPEGAAVRCFVGTIDHRKPVRMCQQVTGFSFRQSYGSGGRVDFRGEPLGGT